MLYPEYQKIIDTLDRIDAKLDEMETKIDKIYDMIKSITDEMEKYNKPKTIITWNDTTADPRNKHNNNTSYENQYKDKGYTDRI